MRVMRVTYYTVRCNRCNSFITLKMEDYTGDISSYTNKRGYAEEMAREYGYLQIGENTWLCPECGKKEGKA